MASRRLSARCFDPLAFPALLAASFTVAVVPAGYALPAGAQVVAGEVAIAQSGGAMTLTQGSRHAIVNWQSFDVGAGERLRLAQPDAAAALLARVTGGGGASELLGSIAAEGKLFLINPRGVIVGAGATIDTAAFAASTLDVADHDFLAGGALTFQGESDAAVVNLGRIVAREGNVMLFARTVQNAGEIAAPNGTAALGAGTEVRLASPDDPAFVVRFNLPGEAASSRTTGAGVDNRGTIAAAQAQLEAAGGSMYDLAVNHAGVIRAAGVERRPDGRILLTAAGGDVAVTGTVTARAASASGGEILIGGDFQGANPAVANARRTFVGASAQLDVSAAEKSGDGGRAIVWADERTDFLGAIYARAGAAEGDGGFAEVSGKRTLRFAGAVDLSAPAGRRGSLLLDPDNLTIVAGTTAVDPDLSADRIWSANEDTGSPQTLGADTLAGLLLTGDVTLQATDTLTVDSPVTVAAGGNAAVTLTLQASTLAINQSVSLANVTGGRLHLFHYAPGPGTSLTTAASATVAANRLRIGGFPITTFNGPISASRLDYDNLGNPVSLTATHAANAIADLRITTDEADPQTVAFSGNVAVQSTGAMNVAARLQTPGTVTLTSAGEFTVRDVDLITTALNVGGMARLGSTGGVFVNQAGADLFAGAGRRLIYTANLGGNFSLGGLAGFTTVNGVSFPQDPQPGLASVVYRADGLLTITANSFSRLYGQPDPAFTASYSGGTAANLTTLPTLSLLGGPAVNVGTYTIVASGAASSTHTINYVNGTLTINPATLTYVADSASRTTLGTNPAFSGIVTGLVNGDTLASATTGALSFTSPATDSSPAGTYAIEGSGLTANHGNYVFVQAAGNATAFSITPPAGNLTITANSASRLYGQPDPAFTASYSGGTAANLTTLPTLSLLGGPAVNVGTYTIVPAGAASDTHTISYVNGTLRIDPATLMYLATPATRVTVGPDPVFGGSVTGFVNGDTLASATSGTLTFATAATSGSPAGAYAINGSGLTANHGNYVFVQAPGNATAFTIKAAPLLTITANDFIRQYGQPNPVFTVSYAGGSAADLTKPPVVTIAGGPAVNAGRYTLVPSGAASTSHELVFVNGTLTINPATLTYLANPAARLYGDPNPTFSGSVTGFVNGDTLASATSGALTFTSPTTAATGAGSHAILGGGLAANHGNYVFVDAVANFTALTVNPAPLTIAFNDATRVYGAADPVFSATFAGFRNGDTAGALAGFGAGTNATPQSPVGTYQIGGSAQAANYAITIVPGTLTIAPAPLTLTVNPATFTFGGTPPAPSYTLAGLVGGDTPAVLTGVQFDTAAFAGFAPGTHLVSPTNLGAAQNYTVASVVPGAYTVNRRGVIVSGDNRTSLAGAIPPLSASASFAPVPTGPQFTLSAITNATPNSPAGNYLITPLVVPAAGTSLAQVEAYYDFTRINGTLTLNPVPADTVVLKQPIVPLEQQDTIVQITTTDLLGPAEFKLTDFNLNPSEPVVVGNIKGPISQVVFNRATADMKDELMALIMDVFDASDGRRDAAGNPIRIYKKMSEVPDEHHAIFSELFFGRMSFEQLLARMDTDATARAAIMPLFMAAFSHKIEQGGPLSPAMATIAERMADRITTQRKAIADDMQARYNEWAAQRGSAFNPVALNAMPDFAAAATQKVVEERLAGAVVGGTLGTAALAGATTMALHLNAAAVLPKTWSIIHAGTEAARWKAFAATGISAGAATVVVAAATFAIVGITASIVQLIEEGQNKQAFDNTLKRAATPVAANLSGLDFRNDSLAQGEFLAAFTTVMSEIKFKPGI